MALIDEYKQAIKDVLDGRAKPAPSPSALPLTEDKLATLWAAAAAELIAEESGGSSGGGVLVVNATRSGGTITCDTKASVMYAAFEAGTTIIIKRSDGYESVCIGCLHDDEYGYIFDVPFPDNAAYGADTDDDYPVAHVE